MRTVRAPYLENKVLPEQQQELPADDHQLGFGFGFGLSLLIGSIGYGVSCLVGHSGPSFLQNGDSRTETAISALVCSQRQTLLENWRSAPPWAFITKALAY